MVFREVLVLIAFMAAGPLHAETMNYDYSKKIDSYFQFNVTAAKTFTVTKVTAALTAWSKPMTLVLRCDGKELAAQRKTFTNMQLNQSQTFTVTAEINARSCPLNTMELYFESPGLDTTGTPIVPNISRGRLLDDDFVRLTNDQLDSYTDDLISYSATMSEHAASQNTMYCIIKTYENRPGHDGIIRELVTNFYNIFGILYENTKLPCPSQDSLANRIDECIADRTIRTPFCNTTKLYLSSKQWFMDSYAEARVRALNLSAGSQVLLDDLNTIKSNIKAEVEASDSTLGITTEFEE